MEEQKNFKKEETTEIFTVENGDLKSQGLHKVMHFKISEDQMKKNSAEIEELKQIILECRGLYKGFKINETTAAALAVHLHLVNYRKEYRVRGEIETQKEQTIHLPVKFDTPLYFLWSRHQVINYVQHTSGIYETTNWKYSLSKNGIYITTTGKSVSYCGQFLYKLGETVFLTNEEAEAKLKKLEGKK